MKTISIYILLVLLNIVQVFAQSKKGYKNLEKAEYDKAKDAFEKVLENDPENSAANFGLAMVFSDEKFAGYNHLKAWGYMIASMNNTSNLSGDDMQVMAEYFVNIGKKASWPVKKKMEREKDILEVKLIKHIREENDLEFINELLTTYKDYKYYDNVIHLRNYIEFRNAEKSNTIEALEKFMKTYPDAAQIKKAKKIKDDLTYDRVKQKNTIEAYNDYIIKYPNSYKRQEALQMRNQLAYKQAKTRNTIEAYEEFINKYPDASQVLEAKRQQMLLCYESAKAKNTYQAYTDFLRKYPEGREYVDIFNLKSAILAKKYIDGCGQKPQQSIWIRAFDNQGKNEIAGGIATTSDGSIVMTGSTPQEKGIVNDAWVIKLDVDGKMMWNKFIGDEGENRPHDLAVDKQGAVIVGGNTNPTKVKENMQAWVFKLGDDGKKIWNRSLGSTQVNTVATATDNSIVAGGFKYDSAGVMKLLLYKLKHDGKKLWSREYTVQGVINDLSIDKGNNIIIASDTWIFKLDPDGYIIWEAFLNGGKKATTACADAMGNAYLAGSTGNDIWVAKYTTTGEKAWEKTIDHNGGTDAANAISVSMNQQILVGGKSGGDALVVKLGGAGNVISKYSFGNRGNDEVHSVCTSKDGKVLIQSSVTNTGSSGDLLLIKGN